MNKIEFLKKLKSSFDLKFYTKSGLLISIGYDRLVIGQRGPYVEFSSLIKENIHIPKEQYYRLKSSFVYYDEYRTNDVCNVKVYFQKKIVKYADYKLNKWYISPYDLEFDMKENKIENYFEWKYGGLGRIGAKLSWKQSPVKGLSVQVRRPPPKYGRKLNIGLSDLFAKQGHAYRWSGFNSPFFRQKQFLNI